MPLSRRCRIRCLRRRRIRCPRCCHIRNLPGLLPAAAAGRELKAPEFRARPERARPYLFALCLIPFAGVFLLLKFGKDLGLSLEFLNRMPELNALGLIGLFPLAALAGLGASFLLSSRILERKEF